MARGAALLLMGALVGPAASLTTMRVPCDATNQTIYPFNATTLYRNETIPFERYQGKVVLVFNVATYCGLTRASYIQINALVEQFKGEDLVILGYPCNQFGKQEPAATPDEIMNGIRHVRPGGGFEPQLTMFEKIDVNGENEIPLYSFLKGVCGPTFTQFPKTKNLFYEPLRIGDIAWNFEKFLIGRDGRPMVRYHPHVVKPEDMAADIRRLLDKRSPFAAAEEGTATESSPLIRGIKKKQIYRLRFVLR